MNNPIWIFKENWKKARALDDAGANYCTFVTVAKTGQPSVRTLVLREVTEDSFVLFINNTSPKWEELQHSEQFEMHVFWPSLMQQYRIRGHLGEVSVESMRVHWARKPYNSKIIDHFYSVYQAQSSEVESRESVLKGIRELKKRYPTDADIRFPDNAKGISIRASYIEVWHGSVADRLHHRNLYLLSDGTWGQHTLVP